MRSSSYKKIMLILSAAAIALYIPSCKRYLDQPVQGQLTQSAIANDPNTATMLVNGAYNSLWLGEAFGIDVHSLNFVILTEVASDNSDKGSSPNDYQPALEVDNFTLTPGNSIVNNIWTGYYRAIARVNQAITTLNGSTALQAGQRDELLAEVRFLRGYFYFNMVRFFGGVPLIRTVPAAQNANDAEFQTRASADSVYNLVISDLQFGVDHLLSKGNTQPGRVTRGAAMSLLAKVYMYRKSWQNVLSLTDSVIAGKAGNYDLYPQYENIWRQVGENNIESIFEVQTGINNQCNTAIQLYVVSQGPRGGGKFGWQDLGFGFNSPTQDLVNSYEPGDVRMPGTIIFIDTSGTHRGTVLWDGFRIPSKDSVENSRYNYKAYHSRTQEKNCGNTDYLPKNLRLLRFGEVLLMNAEAANELNDPAKALTSLNRVRTRAHLPAIAAGLSQQKLRDTIWHERRVELAMEHDRFFDIVRQGRAAQLLRAQGKNFTAGKNEVFPIPATQIQLSGGRLTQNPGY